MWEGRDFAALLEWWCEWLLREEGRYPRKDMSALSFKTKTQTSLGAVLLPWPTAELNSTAFFLLFL